MKQLEIINDDYIGSWNKSRVVCRGIVIKNNQILLSHLRHDNSWMIPGGGLEDGEDEKTCVEREVAEETGYIVKPSECVLEIAEYYEAKRLVTRYFFCEITGQTEVRLTAHEQELGMEPCWRSIDEILAVYADYQSYKGKSEVIRGTYQREYTALCELLKYLE